ncbi:hypothetical protein [Lysobacter sp. A3-1-A15]|uniref:hypothetical protein n=1 Tax=Novilysobacter viscosus TaxID=3098602 RepID=UPI002EDA74B1
MRRSVRVGAGVVGVVALAVAALLVDGDGMGRPTEAGGSASPALAGDAPGGPVVESTAVRAAGLPGGLAGLDRVPTNVELEDKRELDRWTRQFEAAVAERVAMLLERGDAGSLYEAYLLMPGSGAFRELAGDGEGPAEAFEQYSRDRSSILQRARGLAPDDVHLALLAALECGVAYSGCDRASAIEDLLRLQPDNALGALFALDAALEAGDRAAIDRWLARAADADYYDMGYTRTVGDYARAFASVPSPPLDPHVFRRSMAWSGLESHDAAAADDPRDLHALIVAGAHPLPSTVGLSGLCSARRVSLGNRANCHRIWRHMAASDTALAQMMSLSHLVQMTGDATGRRHWQERLRHFSWITQEASRFLDMQALREQSRLGELQAWERLMQRRGITMPAGWLPDNPHYRSLIQTGRPPPDG